MVDKDDIEKSADFITEQEREFAISALNEFNNGNYGACLQNLNKLDNRTQDFKVVHNKAVAEYHKSDLRKTDAFRKNINALYNQFRIRVEKLDDVDHCVAHFNQAVLLFHQRQYTAAMRIMDRVYKFIEPMDETLAKQVSLLLMELQLSIKQPDKVIALITYLENHLVNVATKTDDKSEVTEKDVADKKVPVVDESFKQNLIKYKARYYLMNHDLGSAKNAIQQLPSQDENNMETSFITANLEYLLGNHQESLKILNSIPADALNYLDIGESSAVMLNNNIGVIHHAMGKPNLACFYYQQALREDVSITFNTRKDNADRPLYTVGGSKYHELMYNLGVSLLHAGRPTQAFDCLTIAVRRYHRNSRLWLRLAECCISVHKETNEVDFDIQKKQKELVAEIIGTKEKQRIVLTTNFSCDKKYSTESQSYAVPVATLEFASLCLKNAYLLLPSETTSSPVPLLLIPGVTPPAPPPNPGPAPSAPLGPSSVASLRNAILAASAYISLCLGDYILALEHAQNLLMQPELSGAYKFLAHLYTAESLVLLDKISDAIEHLNPENVKDISLELPQSDAGKDEELALKTNPPAKWFPSTTASAHAVMHYNIAVAKTIRGQLDQAAALLKQIWQVRGPSCRVPAHILMLILYIELQLGHADIARSLIKQYSFQHRFSVMF